MMYRIASRDGSDFGLWEGDTKTEALVSLLYQAGYADIIYIADMDVIGWPDNETRQLCGDVDNWEIWEA